MSAVPVMDTWGQQRLTFKPMFAASRCSKMAKPVTFLAVYTQK